ncbi:MAG: VPLPA-CTERM sorting domain-containing protein [Gammaproteobacteria bacterium]|nr:VPLPA-CTERM sorting domain-containing protein [Gammaproteobacteria bacterium]MDH5593505.1 VPLPA-CTERM sorting domain-containing protein [Gammaproteobacteria bacterium]
MKSHNRWGLNTLLFSLVGFSSLADAALVSRLGGLAYYDTEADLTWLADANAAAGSVYDTYDPGSGKMIWADANAWAASLNVNGVTGWRLPSTVQPDSSCDSQYDAGTFGLQSYGYNCTGSEMGNLIYNVLGGVAATSITTTHNANYDLFSNIQHWAYWSATEYAPDSTQAFLYGTRINNQAWGLKTENQLNAWAVYSGDVSAVPVPAAVWLFGSGLIGLAGVARNNKNPQK